MTFAKSTVCGLFLAAGLAGSCLANTITVPNSGFDVYKQGTGQTVYCPDGGMIGFAAVLGNTQTALVYGGSAVNWSDSSYSGEWTPVDFPGWATTGGGAIQGTGVNGSTCFAGNNVQLVDSTGISATITAGLDYTLSADCTASGGNALTLNLLANGSPVTTASPIAVTGSWVNYSVTFTSAQLQGFVGQALQVEVGAYGSSGQTQIDNVTLSTIPEPSTIVLLGIGLMGLVAYAWRRRK